MKNTNTDFIREVSNHTKTPNHPEHRSYSFVSEPCTDSSVIFMRASVDGLRHSRCGFLWIIQKERAALQLQHRDCLMKRCPHVFLLALMHVWRKKCGNILFCLIFIIKCLDICELFGFQRFNFHLALFHPSSGLYFKPEDGLKYCR